MVSASDDRNRTYANCADGGWGGKRPGPPDLPAQHMLYILTGSNKIVGVRNLCRMVRTALYLLKETVGIVV